MLVERTNKISQNLHDRKNFARFTETFEEVAEYVKANAHGGSVVITMGAGDVYHIANKLLN